MTTNQAELPDLEIFNDPLDDLGLDFETEVKSIHDACDKATFGELTTIRPATEQSIQRATDAAKRIKDFIERPKQGEPLYMDFETIPDFDRIELFELPPLPEMPPVDGPESLMAADQFISQTVPEIEGWLAKHNPPREWVDEVLAAERAIKKPRKGFLDAIADHTKRIDSIASAEADRIKFLSLRPFFCKIVCVAFAAGDATPVSIYADGIDQEKQLIERVWQMLTRYTPVIGYGMWHFDIPVLLARSMILGVKPERFLDRRKYGSKDILDLSRELFGDERGTEADKGTRGLKAVCRHLGISPDAGDAEGSRVYGWWQQGKIDEICTYCESDVVLCQRLHREKMAGYFCV